MTFQFLKGLYHIKQYKEPMGLARPAVVWLTNITGLDYIGIGLEPEPAEIGENDNESRR